LPERQDLTFGHFSAQSARGCGVVASVSGV